MKPDFVVKILGACGLLLLLGVTALFFAVTTNNDRARALDAAGNVGPAIQVQAVEIRPIQYVDRPTILIEKETLVERVPATLRNYEDIDELRQWLADFINNTNTLYVEQPGQPVDCDDYALALQQNAMADGFVLNVQIMNAAEYNQRFTMQIPDGTLHALNLAIAANKAYYVEPQNGEIVFAAHLD